MRRILGLVFFFLWCCKSHTTSFEGGKKTGMSSNTGCSKTGRTTACLKQCCDFLCLISCHWCRTETFCQAQSSQVSHSAGTATLTWTSITSAGLQHSMFESSCSWTFTLEWKEGIFSLVFFQSLKSVIALCGYLSFVISLPPTLGLCPDSQAFLCWLFYFCVQFNHTPLLSELF